MLQAIIQYNEETIQSKSSHEERQCLDGLLCRLLYLYMQFHLTELREYDTYCLYVYVTDNDLLYNAADGETKAVVF